MARPGGVNGIIHDTSADRVVVHVGDQPCGAGAVDDGAREALCEHRAELALAPIEPACKARVHRVNEPGKGIATRDDAQVDMVDGSTAGLACVAWHVEVIGWRVTEFLLSGRRTTGK